MPVRMGERMSEHMKATLPTGIVVEGTPEQLADLFKRLAEPPQCSCVVSILTGAATWFCPIHGQTTKTMPDSLTGGYFIQRSVAPCRTCSSAVMCILGPWTCQECGTTYPDNNTVTCTTNTMLVPTVATNNVLNPWRS